MVLGPECGGPPRASVACSRKLSLQEQIWITICWALRCHAAGPGTASYNHDIIGYPLPYLLRTAYYSSPLAPPFLLAFLHPCLSCSTHRTLQVSPMLPLALRFHLPGGSRLVERHHPIRSPYSLSSGDSLSSRWIQSLWC